MLLAGGLSLHRGFQRHAIGPLAVYGDQRNRDCEVRPFITLFVVGEIAKESGHTDVQ